jgi:hypothetical protein
MVRKLSLAYNDTIYGIDIKYPSRYSKLTNQHKNIYFFFKNLSSSESQTGTSFNYSGMPP